MRFSPTLTYGIIFDFYPELPHMYYYIRIYMYKIFFRKCRFVSLPAGQILNINTFDHWPMPTDTNSAHSVATYMYATRVMHRNHGEHGTWMPVRVSTLCLRSCGRPLNEARGKVGCSLTYLYQESGTVESMFKGSENVAIAV